MAQVVGPKAIVDRAVPGGGSTAKPRAARKAAGRRRAPAKK
jgi:hypothetical protein